MSIFDAFKPKPKIKGEIGYFGLADWWLSEFTEAERNHIETVFRPLSTGGAQKSLTEGEIYSTTGTAVGLLYALAGWFKKPDDIHIAKRILAKAEAMLPTAPVLDQHFAYHTMIEIYEKDKQNPSRLDLVASYCRKQIEIAPNAIKAFKRDGRKSGDLRLPSHGGYSTLGDILEKAGATDEAIAIYQQAKRQGWAGAWDKYIERMEKPAKPKTQRRNKADAPTSGGSPTPP